MPPGPVYNWLCVAHSVVDILSISARIRAEQIASRTCQASTNDVSSSLKRRRHDVEGYPDAAPLDKSAKSQQGVREYQQGVGESRQESTFVLPSEHGLASGTRLGDQGSSQLQATRILSAERAETEVLGEQPESGRKQHENTESSAPQAVHTQSVERAEIEAAAHAQLAKRAESGVLAGPSGRSQPIAHSEVLSPNDLTQQSSRAPDASAAGVRLTGTAQDTSQAPFSLERLSHYEESPQAQAAHAPAVEAEAQTTLLGGQTLARDAHGTSRSLAHTVNSVPDAAAGVVPLTGATPSTPQTAQPHVVRQLQASKVPSSRIGRLFHYGGLAASLGYGAASEILRRTTSSSDDAQSSSLFLTEANVKRLVAKLTQMRGAALKMGQFLSIQDSHMLPPQVEEIFRRVQDSAHHMPDWQMEEVLRSSLGPSWADHFESFDRIPFAAASIGQVHTATLNAASSPTGEPARVAVKIQFPNIVNSINSDVGYVKMLLTAGSLLPKGLFLDRTIEVMKEELADECNYLREASFGRKFGQPSYLGGDPRFKVPWIWEGSTERVLVMEYVDGVSVGGSMVDTLSQEDRNDIAARILELCLKELFVFRLMQTDPNWTNFLWNGRTRQIQLVDFGATREYSKAFMDMWLRLLSAAAADDRAGCIQWSLKLGYLTGKEGEEMLDAHVKSMTLLATPFKAGTPQPFAFGAGSQWADITAEIREQIPVMLRHRLTPPPRETYSLNRKLSGAFLLASRLGATIDTKALWDDVVKNYTFDADE